MASAPIPVHDASDPRLDRLRDLRDRDQSRSARRGEPASFVAEGPRVIARLLAAGITIEEALLAPRRAAEIADDLLRHGAQVFEAEQAVIDAVVGFPLHRGAVAIGRRPDPPSLEDILGRGTIAVLEGVRDLENLGTILRSAAALGVDGLVLDATSSDPWYRRVVRVSMGTVALVPTVRVGSLPDALARIRRSGYTVVALTPDGDAATIDEAAARIDHPVALLLGSEDVGLTDAALGEADAVVRIPMREGVDSLNVAHAAAIAFHRFGVIR